MYKWCLNEGLLQSGYVPDFGTIKVRKNEENVNNSYNHIGEIVKNSEEKIELWKVETLIYKTKMSLMILKRIDNSFDTTRYTSVLF